MQVASWVQDERGGHGRQGGGARPLAAATKPRESGGGSSPLPKGKLSEHNYFCALEGKGHRPDLVRVDSAGTSRSSLSGGTKRGSTDSGCLGRGHSDGEADEDGLEMCLGMNAPVSHSGPPTPLSGVRRDAALWSAPEPGAAPPRRERRLAGFLPQSSYSDCDDSAACEWVAPTLGREHHDARCAYNAGVGAFAADDVLRPGLARQVHQRRKASQAGTEDSIPSTGTSTTLLQSSMDGDHPEAVLSECSREDMDDVWAARCEYNKQRGSTVLD
uniref:Uncharacterized protein n=1 Tax=Hemiselmis andersenii TaxID=464988 RepID=A0A7S0UG01_HEMAN